jgi:calmodulin
MLRVLKEQEFEPDEPETVLAAFRLLDPEGKGYIEIEEMKRLLEHSGIEFGEKETEDFANFSTNKDPNATVIYYEDYLSRLYSFVDKHLENVMKGYATFQEKK